MDSATTAINKKFNLLLNVSFIACLLVTLLTHFLIFININLGPIDSDQPFMWIGASDYAKGHFYEPRFYGQDYNTFMEALFSVPFIWCGLPVYAAVPLATHLIFLTPVLFPAIYLFTKGKKKQGLMILLLLLCMPVEYDMLNSLPRGFVTGLFFSGFFILSIEDPHKLKYIVLNTFFAILGYFVNPNSLIVSLPVLFFIFLHNLKDLRYYYATFACLLTALPLHLLFNQFYINHPDYVIYGLQYNFDPIHLFKNISHLPASFVHISPFAAGNALALFGILIAFVLLLWKAEKKIFYTFLGFLIMILASCLSDKTSDGSPWPFYSFSRHYLGVIIFFMLCLSFIKVERKAIATAVIITLLFSCFKFWNFKRIIAHNLEDKYWLGVHLVPLKNMLNALEFYKSKCHENHCEDLVISNPFWLSSYLDYGGPAIYKDFPQTQETNSERRYLVREKGEKKISEKFIYISCKPDLDREINCKDFEMQRLDDYGLFLIRNNRLRMNEFINIVKETENRMK